MCIILELSSPQPPCAVNEADSAAGPWEAASWEGTSEGPQAALDFTFGTLGTGWKERAWLAITKPSGAFPIEQYLKERGLEPPAQQWL